MNGQAPLVRFSMVAELSPAECRQTNNQASLSSRLTAWACDLPHESYCALVKTIDSGRIVVVGGGAAGYFAAITAAEKNRRARILLLESARQPLYKLRISGGGRCNVTHHCFEPDELLKGYPRGHKELIGPFQLFQPRNTVQWFETRGVRLKTEEDGRMFPTTDDAETVARCLEQAAERAGVEVRLHTRVMGIRRLHGDGEPPRFEVQVKDDAAASGDAVLLATGSSPSGYEIARSLGHSIVAPMPSLFTFRIKDARLAGLSGIAFHDTYLRLNVGGANFAFRGPLLITHWGVSGPAVLKLSAFAARHMFMARYQAEMTVDFLPNLDAERIGVNLHGYREQHPTRAVLANPLFEVPKRYWERLVAAAGIESDRTWAHLTKPQTLELVNQLKTAAFPVTGKGEFKDEFVTAGGIKSKEVDFRTMQSRICPGLYFAGEILDIDGITGGYNFQAAWTTGWLAGTAVA